MYQRRCFLGKGRRDGHRVLLEYLEVFAPAALCTNLHFDCELDVHCKTHHHGLLSLFLPQGLVQMECPLIRGWYFGLVRLLQGGDGLHGSHHYFLWHRGRCLGGTVGHLEKPARYQVYQSFARLVIVYDGTTVLTESDNSSLVMLPFHRVFCRACLQCRGCLYCKYGHIVVPVEVFLGIGGMRQMKWVVVVVGIASMSSGELVGVDLGLACSGI